MSLRDDFQDLAKDLIHTTFRDISKPAVLRRRGESLFDPTTGEVTQTEQTASIRAVFQDFKAEQRRIIDVQDGDLQALVANKGLKLKPQRGDQIVQAGTVYDVITVELDAADALYTLHLRRA